MDFTGDFTGTGAVDAQPLPQRTRARRIQRPVAAAAAGGGGNAAIRRRAATATGTVAAAPPQQNPDVAEQNTQRRHVRRHRARQARE